MVSIQTNYLERQNQWGESYRLSYLACGNPESDNLLVCVHGLNRNSRDFDYIALHMANLGYYVIAPDLPGRGNSGYLNNVRGYGLEANVADLVALLQLFGAKNLAFLGTSLGGILGMMIAGIPELPIKHLILNDIGAEVERSGLNRISAYSGEQPDFLTFAEACGYLRQLSLLDGIIDEVIWEQMFRNSFQLNKRHRWELKRDVRIIEGFADEAKSQVNLDLWSAWDKILIPTLIIHGEMSDLLNLTTIDKMCRINPQAEVLNLANVGHAPYLYQPDHLKYIADFLTRIY